MRYLLILSLIFIVSVSCNKNPDQCKGNITISCEHRSIIPYFKGYSASEIDTVIENIYRNDGAFSPLLKQMILTHSDTIDPVSGTIGISFGIVMQAGNDYEILIPGANLDLKFSGIADDGLTKTFPCDYPGGCQTTFTHYDISGGTYIPTPYIDYEYILFKK
jgi:hypothetical protein